VRALQGGGRWRIRNIEMSHVSPIEMSLGGPRALPPPPFVLPSCRLVYSIYGRSTPGLPRFKIDSRTADAASAASRAAPSGADWVRLDNDRRQRPPDDRRLNEPSRGLVGRDRVHQWPVTLHRISATLTVKLQHRTGIRDPKCATKCCKSSLSSSGIGNPVEHER
jgi:hypothetical protein